MHSDDLWLLTVLLWLGLPWLLAYLASGLTSVTCLTNPQTKVPRPLTPRSEDDCPHCRAHPARSTQLRPADPPPPPWTKSRAHVVARKPAPPKAMRASIPTVGIA